MGDLLKICLVFGRVIKCATQKSCCQESSKKEKNSLNKRCAFEYPKGRIQFTLVVLTFPTSLKPFWKMVFARLLSRHQYLLLHQVGKKKT